MDVPDLAGVLVPSSNACKKYAVEVSNGVDAEWSGCQFLNRCTHRSSIVDYLVNVPDLRGIRNFLIRPGLSNIGLVLQDLLQRCLSALDP